MHAAVASSPISASLPPGDVDVPMQSPPEIKSSALQHLGSEVQPASFAAAVAIPAHFDQAVPAIVVRDEGKSPTSSSVRLLLRSFGLVIASNSFLIRSVFIILNRGVE